MATVADTVVVAEPATLPVEAILVNVTNTATGITTTHLVNDPTATSTVIPGLDPQGTYEFEVAKKSQAGKSAPARIKVEYGDSGKTKSVTKTREKVVSPKASTTTTQEYTVESANYEIATSTLIASETPETNAFRKATFNRVISPQRSEIKWTNVSHMGNSCPISSPPSRYVANCTRYYRTSRGRQINYVSYRSGTTIVTPARFLYDILEIKHPGYAYVKKEAVPSCKPGQTKSTSTVDRVVDLGWYQTRVLAPEAANSSWDYLVEENGQFNTYRANANADGVYTKRAGKEKIKLEVVTCTTPEKTETEEYTEQVPVMEAIVKAQTVEARKGRLLIEVNGATRRSHRWATGTVASVGEGVNGFAIGDTVNFRNGKLLNFKGKKYIEVPALSFLVKK